MATEIKILGTGCRKCEKLYNQADQAASELGIEYKIEKGSEIDKIMDYGVMITPALVINEDIKAVGKVPKVEEIKKLLI